MTYTHIFLFLLILGIIGVFFGGGFSKLFPLPKNNPRLLISIAVAILVGIVTWRVVVYFQNRPAPVPTAKIEQPRSPAITGPQARTREVPPSLLEVGTPFVIDPANDTDPSPYRLHIPLPTLKQGDRIVFEREVLFSSPTDVYVNDWKWGRGGMIKKIEKGKELVVSASRAEGSFILFHSSAGPIELAPLRVKIFR